MKNQNYFTKKFTLVISRQVFFRGAPSEGPEVYSENDMEKKAAIDSAKNHVNLYLESKGKKQIEVTKGDVYTEKHPQFDEMIGFIKGHPEDHPKNKSLDKKDVARIVILTIEVDDEIDSIAVALNSNNDLLGIAD